MPPGQFQFSLRILMLVVALLAASLAMIRGGYELDGAINARWDFLSALLLVGGYHLLLGTVGGGIGGICVGWRGALVGAAMMISFAWLLLLFFAPAVH